MREEREWSSRDWSKLFKLFELLLVVSLRAAVFFFGAEFELGPELAAVMFPNFIPLSRIFLFRTSKVDFTLRS